MSDNEQLNNSSRFAKICKSATLKVGVATALLMSVTFTVGFSKEKEQEAAPTLYHIYDGVLYLGAVSSKEKVEKIIEEKQKQVDSQHKELNIDIDEHIVVVPGKELLIETNDELVLQKLAQSLVIKVEAVAVNVGGKTVAYVQNMAAYEQALRLFKLQYVTEAELNRFEAGDHTAVSQHNETRIISLQLSAGVVGEPLKTELQQVVTPKQAVQALNDKLTLTVTLEKYSIEKIDFAKETKQDATILKGESKIVQQGQAGEKQVLYTITSQNGERIAKDVTTEMITQPPTTQVTAIGTKEIPSRGTGAFAWPAYSRYISSYMGPRYDGYHRGIDIARPSDYSIMASDNGVVAAAGWEGSYGNRVVIDHNNGYKTVYAHLASISVSAGQVVPKGATIGVMGTTGNSTGIHLHFEVQQNGALVDPLAVLQ